MIRQIVLDLIRHYLDADLAFPCFYHEEKEMEGVFLLCLPDSSEEKQEKIRECIRKTAAYVENHVDVQVTVGIGTMVNGIPKIVQSVREARRAADQESRRLLLGEADKQRAMREVLFSSKSMRKLSVYLSNGEKKETEAFFHDLESAIGDAALSDDEGKQIFYGIRSVLDGMVKRDGRGDMELPGFEEKWDILEQLKHLQSAAVEICSRMKEKQEKVTTQKRHDVITFIQENFNDSNLCAAMVAERFGVTEKYVFQIVRDCTGKSLGDLIKEIRFAKAEELLQKSVDINKIPEQIGFNSLNTFYKAFKRNYGISPGQWRELFKEGHEKGTVGEMIPK